MSNDKCRVKNCEFNAEVGSEYCSGHIYFGDAEGEVAVTAQDVHCQAHYGKGSKKEGQRCTNKAKENGFCHNHRGEVKRLEKEAKEAARKQKMEKEAEDIPTILGDMGEDNKPDGKTTFKYVPGKGLIEVPIDESEESTPAEQPKEEPEVEPAPSEESVDEREMSAMFEKHHDLLEAVNLDMNVLENKKYVYNILSQLEGLSDEDIVQLSKDMTTQLKDLGDNAQDALIYTRPFEKALADAIIADELKAQVSLKDSKGKDFTIEVSIEAVKTMIKHCKAEVEEIQADHWRLKAAKVIALAAEDKVKAKQKAEWVEEDIKNNKPEEEEEAESVIQSLKNTARGIAEDTIAFGSKVKGFFKREEKVKVTLLDKTGDYILIEDLNKKENVFAKFFKGLVAGFSKLTDRAIITLCAVMLLFAFVLGSVSHIPKEGNQAETPRTEVHKDAPKKEEAKPSKVTETATAPVQDDATAEKVVGKIVTVEKGDSLWNLAKEHYGDGSKWTKIYDANKDKLLHDDARNATDGGHWIHPGQTIVVPAS